MKSISEIINSFAAQLKCSLQHKCCQKAWLSCQRNSTTVNCNVNAHRKINESENLFCSVFILCGNLHYIWCCQAQINSFSLDVRSFWRCSTPNAVRNIKVCARVFTNQLIIYLMHFVCLSWQHFQCRKLVLRKHTSENMLRGKINSRHRIRE